MTSPVRIPADVEMSDRVLGSLTARQLGVLSVTGLALYAVWTLTRSFLPVAAFVAVAAPVMAAAAVLALGKRDGVSMDKLALAAIRQRTSPRRYATGLHEAAPTPAWLADTVQRHNAGTVGGPVSTASPLPARGVTRTGGSADVGVVDLGSDGLAAVAAATTVNFALRTPDEQDGLVALFSRYLHSLTAPVQILARTHRLDLTDQISDLRDAAPTLPHPALRAAALDHADFLDDLAHHANLLRRQILLVIREPIPPGTATPTPSVGGPGLRGWFQRATGKNLAGNEAEAAVTSSARRAAEARLVRRLFEAVELLTPAGITITPLTAEQAVAVLRSACNPDSLLPPTAPIAPPGHVITAATTPPDRHSFEPGAVWNEEWDEELPSSTAGRLTPARPGRPASDVASSSRGSR